MFLIHCPHCGELRDEQEFTHAGEAFIARPPSPESVDDDAWGDYLFMRKNIRGWYWEQWLHASGCRKVIVVKRHTATYEIAGSWTLAEGKRSYLVEEDSLSRSRERAGVRVGDTQAPSPYPLPPAGEGQAGGART